MGLINRLIGNEDPKISVHAFPKAFDLYKRVRISLDQIVQAYELVDNTEAIALVAVGSNKIGLSVGHTWVDDDGVYITSTGTTPGGLEPGTNKDGPNSQSTDLYFVRDSNPAEGTVKLTDTKGGPEADITSEGTGDQTLNLIDPDFVFWDETRKSITSSNGSDDTKLRRRVWDEMAEGIGEVAEDRIEFTTDEEFKEELLFSAQWLTVP